MTYTAFLNITPPTATDQHVGHRIGFVSGKQVILSYRKKPQKMAHATYEAELNRDIKYRKDLIGTVKMFTLPVVVEIDFLFPHQANTAKRDRNKTFARSVRPDVDNMAKGLLDCLMSVGILQDDSLIFDLRLRKFNVPQSKRGVRISITDDPTNYVMNDGETKQETK